jgi:hypothetical protein
MTADLTPNAVNIDSPGDPWQLTMTRRPQVRPDRQPRPLPFIFPGL